MDVDKDTIRKLYDKGVIKEDHVSSKVLDSMLIGIEEGTFRVWTRSSFDPSNPPKTNDGVSICYDCGKMYWVTPMEDAYASGKDGKVCEPCLFSELNQRHKGE